MGLSFRAAYEKIRTPERTVRRGRDPSMPVSLYQEFDNLTRRVDALTSLIGGTNETLDALLAPESRRAPSSPTDTTPKPYVKTDGNVLVPLAGTASASFTTEWVPIGTRFEVRGAQVIKETAATGDVYIEYKDSEDAVIQMLKVVPSSASSFPFGAFVGNDAVAYGSINVGYVVIKTWMPGSIRYRIANASASTRLFGQMFVTIYNEV